MNQKQIRITLAVEIERTQKQLSALKLAYQALNGEPKRVLSQDARDRIAAAQRKRWRKAKAVRRG